jgi:hypothetical protein
MPKAPSISPAMPKRQERGPGRSALAPSAISAQAGPLALAVALASCEGNGWGASGGAEKSTNLLVEGGDMRSGVALLDQGAAAKFHTVWLGSYLDQEPATRAVTAGGPPGPWAERRVYGRLKR